MITGRFPSAASLLVSFVTSALVVVSIAACGGATSEGEGTSRDPGVDGGGGGNADGGIAPSCTTTTIEGRRACVPAIATVGTPITLAIDASDGCLGCFTTLACKVSVSGSAITLTMESTTCPPAGDLACPAVCQIPATTCTVPALAEGTYDVKVSGEGRPGVAPRQLVVGSGAAAASSCTLPALGTPPEPLDLTPYATSCSVDTDCRLARGGNLCAPCGCPDGAIAVKDTAKYEADFRARASTCEGDRSGIACAACAPVKAVCDTSVGLTGVCKKVPATP
jgi:hypothetical protein